VSGADGTDHILGVANRGWYWTKVQYLRDALSPNLNKTSPANDPALPLVHRGRG